jgi:predicted RNase H-like nuclease
VLCVTWLAGVDGCKAGWFRACRDTRSGELAFELLAGVEDLVRRAPRPELVALDMPIGLPDAGVRACDRAARALLEARRSSVFAAPIRAALQARSQREASEVTRRVDGRGVAAQAFGIFARVRQVDEALSGDPELRAALREVHPEVSFWAWNGRRPLSFAKRTPDGARARLALVEDWLGPGILARARGAHRRGAVADDDILDAIAALWTAHRIAAGTAETLPASPPRDATGLPMQIVF